MYLFKVLTFLISLLSLAQARTFTNPLKDPVGSDPFIVYTGGYYYLLTTTWSDVQITRATTLEGLKTGETKVIYTTTSADRCCNVWAPEVHFLNGSWYIYYTAGRSGVYDQQHIHVLRGGSSPWDSYTYVKQLISAWSIDGTVLTLNNANYFIYSCFNSSTTNTAIQSLCASTLTDPLTVGPSSFISIPTQSWETVVDPVNEGPAPLYHGNKTYLAFSASQCRSPSYALGLLEWNGGDPLSINSWRKTGPVFSSANGNYGTGHNGFFNSPDGKEVWNVYHATANSGGTCSRSRYTMAQRVDWRADGSPNFGVAAKLGTVLQGPSGEPA